MSIKPWVRGPFDLLRHGEEHRQGLRDFDRRMALISFDNAIEMAVVTHLDLNPVQRGGQTYPGEKVAHWKRNFHHKLEFIEHFCGLANVPMQFQRDELTFYHNLRNDLYHGGNGTVPEKRHVDAAREAAVWVISLLFGLDAGAALESGDDLVPVPAQPPSLQTQFLGEVLELKRSLAALTEAYSQFRNHQGFAVGLDAELRDVGLPGGALPEEARRVHHRLVEGESAGVSDATLESLTHRLGAVSAELQERLLAHQLTLIEAAFQATRDRRGVPGIIGSIHQATGSGKTSTIIGYLVRCRESDELGHLPQILVVDRRLLAEQAAQAMAGLPGADLLDPWVIRSKDELNEIMTIGPARVAIVTSQRLAMLDGHVPHPVLVVCDGADSGSAMPRWAERFPQGLFIAFSAARLPTARSPWLPRIAQYDLRQAIGDGFLVPVRLDQRTLTHAPSDARLAALRPDTCEALACAVIDHLLGRDEAEVRRGMVIVDSRKAVEEVAQALQREAARRDCGIDVFGVTGALAPHEAVHVWSAFQTDETHGIVVCTAPMLAGRDLQFNVVLYIASPLPQNTQAHLVALAARTRMATHGVIVDFAQNSWNVLADSIESP